MTVPSPYVHPKIWDGKGMATQDLDSCDRKKNWVQAAGGHLWPGDQGETEKWASCFKVANQPKGWQPMLKTEHNLW